jgi:hypothetical protein
MLSSIETAPRINDFVFATTGRSAFQHWDHEKDRLIANMDDEACLSSQASTNIIPLGPRKPPR